MPYTLLDEEVTPSKKGGYVLLNEPTKSNDASDSSIVALGAGLGKGVGTVALNAQKYLGKGLNAFGADTYGDWLQSDANKGLKNLESEVTPYRENSPIATGAGELGGEIAATLPVGGLIGKGVGMLAKAPILSRMAPALENIANAAQTSGMRAGTATGATGLATRAAGGALTGGASAALVDPESAGTGAVIGAALPPALMGIGKASRYAGNVAGSLVQPLTAKGQNEIAGNVLRTFADGGPIGVNATELVKGSRPTLAEATGNAGLATLQRSARDIRPNAFVEREEMNAAARNTAFDEVAGDASKLDYFRTDRQTTANNLYGEALKNYTGQTTPYIRGQINQLLKRPSIDEASRQAQKWAIERGELPSPDGSLQSLHDVKTAIDDKISKAVRGEQFGEARALQQTKDKLMGVMEKLSPEYANANDTYAAMSKPVNAMEILQGMKLTDSRGNMTLQKVQTALRGLQNKIEAPGANPSKSVTSDQIATLTAIRDDLLRQSNLGLGRSAGSNTFQNLATNNIVQNVAGNGLTDLVKKSGLSGALNQAGKLIYSGSDDAIKNRLIDLLLEPKDAQSLLIGRGNQQSNRLANLLKEKSSQGIARAAPVLVSQ